MTDSARHGGRTRTPLAGEYERIRRQVLAPTFDAEGPGYALILRRGMASWMQVAAPCAPPAPPGQYRLAGERPLLPAEGELVGLLAGLVLSSCAGRPAPSTIQRGFYAHRP